MQALRETLLATATGAGAGAAATFFLSKHVWHRAQQQGEIVDATVVSMQKLRGEEVRVQPQV